MTLRHINPRESDGRGAVLEFLPMRGEKTPRVTVGATLSKREHRITAGVTVRSGRLLRHLSVFVDFYWGSVGTTHLFLPHPRIKFQLNRWGLIGGKS